MKLLLCLVFFSGVLYAHPHHHSLAIFDYNNESKQLELSVKILKEDFYKIDKVKKAELYLQQHLIIKANSVPLNGLFHGEEEDHEYVWFYYTFDIALIKGNNALEVSNSILKNINENQFNTVKISLFGNSLTHNFQFLEDSFTFTFKEK